MAWYNDASGEINFGPSFAGFPVTVAEINIFNSALAAGNALALRSGTVLYDEFKRLWSLDESNSIRQFVRRLTAAETWAAMPLDMNVQKDTASDGTFSWTFPTSFAFGVVPNIQITVQDATANVVFNHKIATPTNTAVSGKIDKTVIVSIVGIQSLQFAATGVVRIHLRATQPTP